MRRAWARACALVAAAALAGCQTWTDKADTAMLADCARIANPGERDRCRVEVMTAAGHAERGYQEKLRRPARNVRRCVKPMVRRNGHAGLEG
ncbi:MAG: hypothetical protein WEA77_14955 [Hyphomonas sp.]|uniref:hypothetical protein n=1 Tax=Hyphomonas sp. TaxID=87 RepID=UPI0034A03783